MADKTVTKRDLAKALAGKQDLTQMRAAQIIQSLLDEIADELSAGNRLELRDFGVLEPRLRKGRKARNPRTNEPVYAEQKATVRFKVGKKMDKRLQNCLDSLKENQ